MKLRLLSVESNQTLKLELPSSPTLHQLHQLLSGSISPPSPLPSSAALYLSLNRKEPLIASSPDESLLSLGVTSGDLLYFSTNPLSFSDSPSTSSKSLTSNKEISNTIQNQILIDDLDIQMRESQEIDDGVLSFGDMKKYEMCFLNRVLTEELGNDDVIDYRLLVVAAVHAALLESGFVSFDSVSGCRTDRLNLPKEGFTAISFRYVPLKLSGKIDEAIVLKFHSLGQFVIVYGSLTKSKPSSYRVSLDKNRIAPIFDLVRGHHKDWINYEKELFEFWKMVKDELAFPLLIDLCYSTGVAPTPCLTGLPKELKLKVIESLPGVDLANIECVCREMKSLASNDNLWKQKCVEEFKIETGVGSWKRRFAAHWESKKEAEKAITLCVECGRRFNSPMVRRDPVPFVPFGGLPMIWRDPVPFGGPRMIIGGDYDRLPVFGVPPPVFVGLHGQQLPRRQHILPPCNLGDFRS